MELLDSRGGLGPATGGPSTLEMLEPDELRPAPPPPRTPIPPWTAVLRRPSRVVVAAVVAAVCGVAVGAWSESSAHLRSERSTRMAETDLRVGGIMPTVDDSGEPQRADIYLSNRGPEPVTVTAANLGSQDAVLVPLDVPAGESATLTIPLQRACGHPMASGDLSLRVRTADGVTRSVLLRDGRDFLLNGLTDVWTTDCGVESLSQLSISSQVVVNERLGSSSSRLSVGFGPTWQQGSSRAPVLTGIRSVVAGLEATTGRGWPVRMSSDGTSTAVVDLRVTSCRALHLPTDPDNDALLQVEGQVVPGAATETANLFGASISLALVRAIGRVCPQLLRQ